MYLICISTNFGSMHSIHRSIIYVRPSIYRYLICWCILFKGLQSAIRVYYMCQINACMYHAYVASDNSGGWKRPMLYLIYIKQIYFQFFLCTVVHHHTSKKKKSIKPKFKLLPPSSSSQSSMWLLLLLLLLLLLVVLLPSFFTLDEV